MTAKRIWRREQMLLRMTRALGRLAETDKSKLMNEPQKTIRHPKPGRRARTLINRVVTTILRSRLHGLMSPRLLLLTFTGRKSGKAYTTPIRYVQEGDILRMKVVYPWWKNLRDEATVHVLLRGRLRTGKAEVSPEAEGVVVVKVHLIE